MRYAGLRFFNGEKSEIDLVYNATDEIFKGSIHLDEVSTGLYETATIFVLEEVVNSFGAPAMVTPIGSLANSSFRAEFVKDRLSSKDINILKATLAEDGEFYVSKEDSIELTPQSNAVIVSTTDGIHTVNSTASKEALQLTVGLHSEKDAGHYRYLRIYDTADNHLVAEIYVYGEAVGEDERLAILLSNFGMSLTSKDQALFKDHDINEVGADWKLINRKRKELMLEMSNIKPYIGTYKALLNAIKFFGYNNLTLKEYWLMIDNRSPMFGKMKAVEVPSSASGFTAKKAHVALPSSSYKKTSRFGLFYRLNEADGNFDEWDTPTVQEVFDFTPDEVLIKLYGLKNKLQKEYLPLNAKIIDIIGEGDFYSSYNTNFWNNQNPIAEVVAGIDASIEVEQDIIYIEDLKKVSSLLEGKAQDFAQLSVSDMANLYTDIKDFYSNYYNTDRSTFRDGNTDDIIGAPVQLKCTSFMSTWNDAQFTWDDAESFVTWLNWWKQNIYEVRWHITGPKGYSQTIEGGVDDYLNIALALPYAGSYSVTFEQVDLFNNVMVVRKPNAIEVKMKPLEVYGIYRWKERDDYQWAGSNFKWDGAGGDWAFPQQNQDTVDKEIATLYMSLDRSNYLHNDARGANFSMVRRYKDTSSSTGFNETTGPYFWRNLQSHTWNDGKHNWWDATRVGADISASFKIIQARAGGSLQIEYTDVATGLVENGSHTFTVILNNPTDLGSWQQGADELNNSTDPIISKFVYNPIYIDVDNDGVNDECLGILAVGKGYSSAYDFTAVGFDTDPISGALNGLVGGEINYKSYNPTYNDVRVIEDHAEVELLTHLTFSADKSKMPGKQSYNWKLRNNSQNGDDIYYNSKWLTYLFNIKGDYTLELEVQDINGNVNKLTKNVLTIK